MSPVLFVVSECPVAPGFGGVVILRAFATGQYVYFAPCCGVAWLSPPGDHLDTVATLEDIAPGGVVAPALADLKTAGLDSAVIRTEAITDWAGDIPGLHTLRAS